MLLVESQNEYLNHYFKTPSGNTLSRSRFTKHDISTQAHHITETNHDTIQPTARTHKYINLNWVSITIYRMK